MNHSAHIVVLGAGGFIGAHLSEALLDAGYTVTGVDTHADKIDELLSREAFTLHRSDIRDRSLDLEALVRTADLVIDLIAHANPGIYVARPLDVFRLNFNENLRIAEYCVAHGKRLIQFSSCEVYGKTAAAVAPDALADPDDPALAVFHEDTTDLIMGPVGMHRWIYACAKQLLERVLHAYGLEDQLHYTIVRPFNFIGPKIDYLPQDTDGFPRVFSHFMEALLTGVPMKLVNGGGQRRCYTYIEDAVDCILRVVENPGGVCDRQILNVGNPDNEIAIRDLARLMQEIYREKFAAAPCRLPDPVDVSALAFYGAGYDDSDRRIPDITKVRTLLGWSPRWGIRPLLEETMAYYVREYPGHRPSDAPAT